MVPENVKVLCDDLHYWVQNHTYPPIEIAVRFHYRMVSIHPYINGNGRHSRILADILARQFKLSPFKWGTKNISREGPDRKKYIDSLKAADRGDFKSLIQFATE